MTKHVLNVAQVAVILGEQPKAVRRMIAKGEFPPPDGGHAVVGRVGAHPVWKFETVERWVELRDATPATVPRFEAGPYPNKERCGPVMRMLQMYGIRSRISLDPATGKYSVAIPVTRETTERFETDLQELMPRIKFRLIREDAWLDT